MALIIVSFLLLDRKLGNLDSYYSSVNIISYHNDDNDISFDALNKLNLGPYYNLVYHKIHSQKNAAGVFSVFSAVLVGILILSIFHCEKRKVWNYIFIICSIAIILIFRGLSLYSDMFAHDEGMHLSVAITLFHDMRPFVSASAGTLGLVNQLFIIGFYSILKLFISDIGISFFLLRVINIFIILSTFILLKKILLLRLNRMLSYSILFFYTVFFSFSWFYDIQAFNTEYLFILFTAICIYCIYKFNVNKKMSFIIIFCIICGSMPFIKLQTLPMCFILILWQFYFVYKSDENIIFFNKNVKKKYIYIFSFSCLILPVILLFLVLLSYENGIKNAWFYYITNAQTRIGSHDFITYFNFFINRLIPFFMKVEWLNAVIITIIIILLISLRYIGTKIKINMMWFFSFLFFSFTLISVIIPLAAFHHYILFLIVPLIIFAAETITCIYEHDSIKILFLERIKNIGKINLILKRFNIIKYVNKKNIITLTIIILTLLIFKSFPNNVKNDTILSNKGIAGSSNKYLTKAAQYIINNTNRNDSIVVWGWEQRIYVYSNRRQGTSASCIEHLFDANYHIYPEHNVNIFIADINRNKPKIIIDVVAPGSFAFGDVEKFSLEKHKVWESIKNDYYLKDVIPVQDGSYKIYKRNS